MTYQLAIATADDLEPLTVLIQSYVQNHLDMKQWGGTLGQLQQDHAAGYLAIMLVRCNGRLVGFGAWETIYDLHHCARGATVMDLYVDPPFRCRGLGVALIAGIAAEILKQGKGFLRGEAIPGSAARLYERVAVRFGSNTYNLSGKALSQLASLAGKSPREMVRGLPTREMNYEN
ncbi:MAG: GNAT family N-acetyltransferase [Cyanobacteria bacterium J06638_20]